MKQENHNLSVKRRIYSFPQEGESRAEAICRSFKLYTLVEWAAYTKVDIRIETSKNYPLLIGELSQLMFLLPFFSDAAKVSFSQVFNEANEDKILASNPQPIGFSGILLAKRQNSFYCTYFLHNRNVADTKSPYPIKRLEVIRWFNQKSMVFNQSLS